MTPRRRLSVGSFLSGAILVALPGAILADCASLNSDTTVVGANLYFQPGPGVDPSLIDGAIGAWTTGCGSVVGSGFPSLNNGSNATQPTYTVVLGGANSSGPACGRTSGTTITLYSSASDGLTSFDCGSMTQNLSHEIGHTLGLADAPTGSPCQFFIMAPVNRANAFSRSVQDAECMKADFKWRTPHEGGSGNGGENQRPCV
jgi:hypothetical protein